MSEKDPSVPPSHEEFMEATHEALCKHGYADLTIRKIAAETSKSHSLLTHYYDTKRNLILAYVDYIIDIMEDEIGRSEDADPMKRLESMLDYYTVGTEVYPEELAVALFEIEHISYRDEEFHRVLQGYYEREFEILTGVLADGLEQGVFREDIDCALFSRFVVSTLNGANRYEISGGVEGIAQDVRAFLMSTVFPHVLFADSDKLPSST